jgi:hypothetical protein
MPWLRLLLVRLSLQRPGLVHVGFTVDKVALGQVFSEFFGFPCQNHHSTMAVHTYISLSAEMNNRPIGGRSSETVSPHQHKNVCVVANNANTVSTNEFQ